jgi:tRNA(Leu) C34 or U34 (ribose-2'-O)-methylase TrmL
VKEKKKKVSKKNVTFPFVRIIHSGEGWRDARIIPFDEKNVLKDVSEFADLERFEARYYDRKRAGWVRLKEDSTFSSFMDELKSDDPPRGLEVKLFDTSVIEKVPTLLVDGFFGIGIFRGKTEANHGTLWRSAYQFGASFIFTIGARFDKKKTRATDTVKAWTKIPVFHFDTVEAFASSTPYAAPRVAVEIHEGSIELTKFKHPPRAVYILGAEDDGLPLPLKKCCQHVVTIPTARTSSLNVAAAGSILMYDRFSKIRT